MASFNQVTPSNEDEACMFAMQLASASVLPMALKAAIELDILEMIAAAGPEAQLSTTQIVSKLPTHNPEAPVMIDRILRLLASYSVLTCSLVSGGDGGVERRYGLAPVCKFLTKNREGVSIAPLVLMNHDKVFMECWYHLKDAVLEGGVPFDKAHGMNSFQYPATDPRFNKVFNLGMSNHTTIIMNRIFETYKGFEGIKVLVDVGGGLGASLNMIVSKYPHIKGINYDLPHVLADAPAYSGVEHVGGDMFSSVPSDGNAIFMKSILHDWGEEQCLKILKNCYKALPVGGKVIIVDIILPTSAETDPTSVCKFQRDVLMLAYNPGGKERTVEDFKALATGAGFSTVTVVSQAFHFSVLEFQKH